MGELPVHMGKRLVQPPTRLGRTGEGFAVDDSVRARWKQTADFWDATIVAIGADNMTIRYDGDPGTTVVPLASVKHHGADGTFASGLSGLGGGSARSAGARKRPASSSDKIAWALDRVTKIYVKPQTLAISSVAERVTINFDLSYLVKGKWKPQPPQEVGLLAALEDKLTRDLYVCGMLKFMCDLYHATPSDLGMTAMLGRLEPVSLGERVEERVASIEEQNERDAIYQTHLDAQAALAAVKEAAAAAAAAAEVAAAAAPAAGFSVGAPPALAVGAS